MQRVKELNDQQNYEVIIILNFFWHNLAQEFTITLCTNRTKKLLIGKSLMNLRNAYMNKEK